MSKEFSINANQAVSTTNQREFIANVETGKGGTETVTVRADSSSQAIRKLYQMGYARVSNVTKN